MLVFLCRLVIFLIVIMFLFVLFWNFILRLRFFLVYVENLFLSFWKGMLREFVWKIIRVVFFLDVLVFFEEFDI